ncbi:AAA-ATPase [Quillaja saponaria]|uniref:AAA-ATPase n=1 Tax=Quillaja saponaria TaxID=32244 RepID=A0AAD7PXE9_QUISA|nr:AAA-ATPase [Quillaja saponaria]
MMMMGKTWAEMGSSIAGLMFVLATLQQFFPHQLRTTLQEFLLAKLQQLSFVQKWSDRMVSFFSPHICITFPEFCGYQYNEAFTAIETYLSFKSSSKAKQLKASLVKDFKSLVLVVDENDIADEFNGFKLWWTLSVPKTQAVYNEEMSYYKLTFHRHQREIITKQYLNYVLEEAKEIQARNSQRKLYTNNPSGSWNGYKRRYMWSHIVFEHPATFQTLAMDPKKKEEIINDLIAFSKGKEYYAKIGKAWKRGYLLYGPPGTGKSTMIAAMANLLNYDVYDLELTTIRDNTELRRLLMETSRKSIIVLEDIDCSLDLTGRRKKMKEKMEDKETDPTKAGLTENEETSKVTLSGLLNFIDGIWSACGSERVIVFTTNHKEKLDPALIRRGRMDMHIEMSYCKFEAFKVLAKNYLDVESHNLFGKIKGLLEESNMVPADVAENLMSKSDIKDVESCLENLVQSLERDIKQKAKLKSEKNVFRPRHKFSYWVKFRNKIPTSSRMSTV